MEITNFSDFSYYDDIVILNEEDLQKNIPRIERIIRNSKEYKAYIKFIRETNNIKGCSFFTDKNLEEVSLNIHHIIPLYNLCEIAGRKLLEELPKGKVLLCFDIVKEVIKIHIRDIIPVISLTQTIHELYHSGEYELPKDSSQLHLGDYKTFIQEYKDYLSREYISKVYTYFDSVDNDSFNAFLESEFKEE